MSNILLESLNQFATAHDAAIAPELNAIATFLDLSIDEMWTMSRTDDGSTALIQILNNKVQEEYNALRGVISSNRNMSYVDSKQRWEGRTQALSFLDALKDDFLSVANFFSEGYFAALFLRVRDNPECVNEIRFSEPVPAQEFYICLDQLKNNQNLFNAFLEKLNVDCLNPVFDHAMGMCNWKLLMALYSSGRFDQSRILPLVTMLRLSTSHDAQTLLSTITSQAFSFSSALFTSPLPSEDTSGAAAFPSYKMGI